MGRSRSITTRATSGLNWPMRTLRTGLLPGNLVRSSATCTPVKSSTNRSGSFSRDARQERLRSPKAGRQTEMPASSSSLQFSWTGVKSFRHLAVHGLAKSIFSDLVERDAFHRDALDLAVVKLVALAEEIDALLRVGDHGNHSVRSADNSVQPQRAHH